MPHWSGHFRAPAQMRSRCVGRGAARSLPRETVACRRQDGGVVKPDTMAKRIKSPTKISPAPVKTVDNRQKACYHAEPRKKKQGNHHARHHHNRAPHHGGALRLRAPGVPPPQNKPRPFRQPLLRLEHPSVLRAAHAHHRGVRRRSRRPHERDAFKLFMGAPLFVCGALSHLLCGKARLPL